MTYTADPVQFWAAKFVKQIGVGRPAELYWRRIVRDRARCNRAARARLGLLILFRSRTFHPATDEKNGSSEQYN